VLVTVFLVRSSTPQAKDTSIATAATPTQLVHTPTTRLLSTFQATPIPFTPAVVTMETNSTTANTVTTNTINSVSSISAHQKQDTGSKTVREQPQIFHTTVYTR